MTSETTFKPDQDKTAAGRFSDAVKRTKHFFQHADKLKHG